MERFEIDGFVCKRVLGEGATGNVYLGEKNGQQAAIKVLVKDDGNPMYPTLRRNMQIEVEALKAVGNHAFIIQIIDYGFDVSW